MRSGSSIGYEQPQYNSCGNRHCPNSQVMARERCVAEQEAALLDLPYFHMVITLPAELQSLILQNKIEASQSALPACIAPGGPGIRSPSAPRRDSGRTPRRTTRPRYFPHRFRGESNSACPSDGGEFNLRCRSRNSLRFPLDHAT
jgi:hypothetical protein